MFSSRVSGNAIAADGRVVLVGGRYQGIVPLVDSVSGTAWLATPARDAGPMAVVKVCAPRFADYLTPALGALDALSLGAAAGAEAAGLPGLVAVVSDDEGVSLVFEPAHGEPLDQLLPSFPNGLPLDVGRRAVARLAGALAALHAKGVMHLDLRPATVAIDTTTRTAGLFDWGHAVPLSLVTQGAGRLPGFDAQGVQYASMELLTGRPPHPADDVFAFACVAYEMLTGRHPFARHNATEADALALAVTPVEGLTRVEQGALRRALALPGTRRDVTMAQLAAAFAGERPPRPEGTRDTGGWNVVAVVAAVVLAVAVGLVAWRWATPVGSTLHADAPPAQSVADEARTLLLRR